MTALDDYRAAAPRVTSQAVVARNATSSVPCGLTDSISWVCHFDTPLPAISGRIYSLGVLRKSNGTFLECGVERLTTGEYRFGHVGWTPAGAYEENPTSPPGALSLSGGGWSVGSLEFGSTISTLSLIIEVITAPTTYTHRIRVNDVLVASENAHTFGGNHAGWKTWLSDEVVYFRAGAGTFDGTTQATPIWQVFEPPPASLRTWEVAQRGGIYTAAERAALHDRMLAVDWDSIAA